MTRSGVAASALLERQQNIVPIRATILKALALTTSSPVVCRERRTYRAVRLPTARPQRPSPLRALPLASASPAGEQPPCLPPTCWATIGFCQLSRQNALAAQDVMIFPADELNI